ncbi:DNA repair protein Rad10, partial [Cooperia oncophora]
MKPPKWPLESQVIVLMDAPTASTPQVVEDQAGRLYCSLDPKKSRQEFKRDNKGVRCSLVLKACAHATLKKLDKQARVIKHDVGRLSGAKRFYAKTPNRGFQTGTTFGRIVPRGPLNDLYNVNGALLHKSVEKSFNGVSRVVYGTSVGGAGSRLIVNRRRQEGNPVLKYVRNVRYEWGDIGPDFECGSTCGVLYLALK